MMKSREKQITAKVRVIYAEQIFLYYLISSIDIEVIRTVFILFYEEILNVKNTNKSI